MLEKLEIVNFQSHQLTKLEFSPGVNVMVGPSDNGKSAILRALFWLIQNKPDGMGFVSHWNLTPKGVIKGTTEVILKYDEGVVTRRRTKDCNQYILNENVLDAVGRDVPAEVSKSLNISDVNIQTQLAPHFLLADSAGEVARILNRTIRLDDIDKFLSLVEQKKRATKNSVESISSNLIEFKNEIENLSWIDGVDLLIGKLRNLVSATEDIRKAKTALADLITQYADNESQSILFDTGDVDVLIEQVQSLVSSIDDNRVALMDLKTSLERYQKLVDEYNRLCDIEDVELILTKAESTYQRLVGLKESRIKLIASFTEYDRAQGFLNEVGSIQDVTEYISLVENIQNETSSRAAQVKVMRDLMSEYIMLEKQVSNIDEDIHSLQHDLPDVCPLCNGTGKLKE